MSDNAFLFDMTKCTGCKSCQIACKEWNKLPAEISEFYTGDEYTHPKELSAITWNHVVFSPVKNIEKSGSEWDIIHKKCNHCKKARCIPSCPVNAIEKHKGWNIIDRDKCIGCGNCSKACPYKVPAVNRKSYFQPHGQREILIDKAYKCDACTSYSRKIPACAENCITGALSYGYRLEILNRANKRLKKIKRDFPKARIYGVNEFGGLRVISLLKGNPKEYNLPDKTL